MIEDGESQTQEHDGLAQLVEEARCHIDDSSRRPKQAGHSLSFTDSSSALHHNSPRNALHHNSANSLPVVPHQPLRLTGTVYPSEHRGWTPTADSELSWALSADQWGVNCPGLQFPCMHAHACTHAHTHIHQHACTHMRTATHPNMHVCTTSDSFIDSADRAAHPKGAET